MSPTAPLSSSPWPSPSSSSPPLVWTGSPVHVVSLGCTPHAVLAEPAVQAIGAAEVIFGAEHQFAAIEPYLSAPLAPPAPPAPVRRSFPTPFAQLAEQLAACQSQAVVVLATGDALCYGVGSYLVRLVGAAHLIFHPNLSSVQYCLHHFGLAWQTVDIVSLHGRPLGSLRRHLTDRAWLAVLVDATATPARIAEELCTLGLGASRMWICQNMASRDQTVHATTAGDCTESADSAPRSIQSAHYAARTICMIQLGTPPPTLPTFPGLADHLFSTDGATAGRGMFTKREVRLAILSHMQPCRGEIAWDIGAGCGSVSVEWARWNRSGRIYAIEHDPTRAVHIATNCARFGVAAQVEIVRGRAPDCCADLPPPDCIFIGGSGDLAAMLAYAWETLSPAGKLVAVAVTAVSQRALADFMTVKTKAKCDTEWVEIQVRKTPHGAGTPQPFAPVALMQCTKPAKLTKSTATETNE